MSHNPDSDPTHPKIRHLEAEISTLQQRLEQDALASQDISAKLEQLTKVIENTQTDLASHKTESAKQIEELSVAQQGAANRVPQHEHAEIGGLRVDLSSLNANVGNVQKQLTAVETTLTKHEKGLLGFFQRSGIVVGVLGALLAGALGFLGLPKAIKEYRSKPQTKLVTGWPLELSYDPKAKKIVFTFAAKLGNDGGKADTIKEVRASFRPSSVSAEKAQSLTSSLNLTEKEVPVHPPFEVGTSSPRELFCTATADLGDNDVSFFIQPGLNYLEVNIIGEDGQTRGSANYCFWVMKNHLEGFAAATSNTTIKFVNQYQGCQGKN